jgi:hypothetical protein
VHHNLVVGVPDCDTLISMFERFFSNYFVVCNLSNETRQVVSDCYDSHGRNFRSISAILMRPRVVLFQLG